MRMRYLSVLFALLLLSPTTSSATLIRLTVTIPADTPDDAVVYLASALDQWKADARPLSKQADGTWLIELDLEPGTTVEYKLTLGAWQTVEKGPQDEEVANRILKVGDAAAVERIIVARWASGETPKRESTVVGALRLHENFESATLKNRRTIRVWLPPGYDDVAAADQARRYPVLYLHDGQNCFDAATSAFGNEWRFDETATELIGAGRIEPIILVGIDNMGADRIIEYTPVSDVIAGTRIGGGAERYERFIVEELKPFIDQTYRTLPDRANTAIAGSSLGGLVSLDGARRFPNVFGKAAVVSPSLWWADGWALRQDFGPLKQTRVWLDMGTSESPDAESSLRNLQQAQRLAKALTDAGATANYVEAQNAAHNEQAWAQRVDEILLFLFPAP